MVCIYHIFIIHLPAVEHLGCFYLLTVVNSTTINMAELVPTEQDVKSLGVCQGVV